jgi:glycosyltransferase involved in cell wall biosynthesis
VKPSSEKRTLIFDHEISGHHLEYLNHLYIRAGEKSEETFIFVINPDFEYVRHYFIWPEFKNVKVVFIDRVQILKIESGSFRTSFELCSILKMYVKREHASHIFLISLMVFLPFLPVFLTDKVRVSGIIYSIMTRSYRTDSIIKRFQDALKYRIFTGFRVFDRIFLLNDAPSSRLLNRKYRTGIFRSLPEPIIPLRIAAHEDLRKTHNIVENKKIFLHFGGLSARKGTLELLKAIKLLKSNSLENACFIFAGKVNDDIRNDFYSILASFSTEVKVVIYDKFCSYELLGALCSVSDYIVMPYNINSRSSGLLGYSAQFNVPVIGPSEGLIGVLIRRYDLGFRYHFDDSVFLAGILDKHILMPPYGIDGNAYLINNSISRFQEAVFN